MPISKDTKLNSTVDKPRAKRKTKEEKGFAPEGVAAYPTDYGIARAVDQQLRSERTEKVKEYIYASSVLDCARQQWYELNQVKGRDVYTDNPNWLVTAFEGDQLHLLVERALKAAGVLLYSEYKVGEETNLRGRVDDVIKVGNRLVVGDVKSVSHEDYLKGAHSEKFTKYIAQLSIYGYFLNIRKGVIILIDRSKGNIQEIGLDLDFEYAETLLKRADWIIGLWKDGILPPAEIKGSRACNLFCPFVDKCYSEES